MDGITDDSVAYWQTPKLGEGYDFVLTLNNRLHAEGVALPRPLQLGFYSCP